MMTKKRKPENPHLEVYLRRSVLVASDGSAHEFLEGLPSDAARSRYAKILAAFESGFLVKVIEECRTNPAIAGEGVDSSILEILTRLVDSVTSEMGRGLVGLTVLQLAIKAIAPDQSIRLHKGGARGDGFSWVDGVPMRVLDNTYNTPALRQYNLLKLNADGCFMTRSLAENYPYSKLYKAALRGARSEWLDIVDLIETGQLDPMLGLKQTISMLFNRSDAFVAAADKTLTAVKKALGKVGSLDKGTQFVLEYVNTSEYSARVLEIAMHALFQVLEEAGAFQGFLKPLSQMRSANKKHGNIGDIELVERVGSMRILESWDAKYGKPYLRDELEELNDKLVDHPETEVVGFVVEGAPTLKRDVQARKAEIEEMHGVKVSIQGFEEWVRTQARRVNMDGVNLARKWIVAFTECLCQKRRDRAPIDEPADAWVAELAGFAASWESKPGCR